jgi:osmotically-inducible protein OsmY
MKTTPRLFTLRRTLLAGLTAGTLAGTVGCVPILLGAAAGTAMVATDRRSSGTQVDDQTIELRGVARARDAAGANAHINVTSYNRMALITGEVSGEADRAAVAKAVAGVDNVRSVVNELVVAPSSTLGERTADSVLTGRVKASFVEAVDVPAAAFKVVTERGVVYLMGRVTEGEAARATERARSVTNVKKVVRLMEILSDTEAAALKASAAKAP